MVHLISTIVTIAALLLSIGSWTNALNLEIMRIESEINPDKVWDAKKLKVVRVKPGTYGLDGNLELLRSLDDTTTMEVKAYFSPTQSGQYSLLPFRFTPTGYCNFFNTNYKKYAMDSITKASNFPVVGDERFCPLEKGTYTFKKYVWDHDSVKNIVKPGFYKVHLISKLPNGDLSDLLVVVQFTAF